MLKPITVLKQTRKLLSNPKKWCKGDMAQDAKGNSISYLDRRAKRFCLYGAMCKVSTAVGSYELLLLFKRVNKIKTEIGPWNDHPKRTHAQILKALDKAIKHVEQD